MTDPTTAPAPITHVLMVTDRSGSMAPLADDVRGGFNTYVDDLAKTGGNYRLTVRLFNHRFKPLCTNTVLDAVPRLDATNYVPEGFTALLDAVGRTITEFEAEVGLGEGDRVLLVVQTDGAENNSYEFSMETIRAMITSREAGGRWSCVFLGAGADTWKQAAGMGFAGANTVSLEHTSVGTRSSYSGLTQSTVAYAAGATGAEAAAAVRDAAGTKQHS